MSHEPHKEIHKRFRKHAPESVKKAKKLFSFKYPKLFILIILILLAYYIFTQPFFSGAIGFFNNLGNLGIFLSGMMTAAGFTAPFGIGILSRINPSSIIIAAMIAGLGSTIADLFIFKSMKFSFADEFRKLEKTKLFREVKHIAKKHKSVLVRHYLLYIFAGIVFATPIPDEVGVSMLAGLTTIKPFMLAIISFTLHSFAIFLFLSVI